MGQFDADLLGAFDYGGGRCGAGDLAGDAVGDSGAQFLRRIDQHRVDDRRAAHMGHLVVADGVEHRFSRSTRRRQTLTPARSAIVHGKHQPLQ